MRVIVTTTESVGEDLRRPHPGAEAAAIADRIAVAGGQLYPHDYAVEQFVIEVDDGAALIGQLGGLPGIDSVYAEPEVR